LFDHSREPDAFEYLSTAKIDLFKFGNRHTEQIIDQSLLSVIAARSTGFLSTASAILPYSMLLGKTNTGIQQQNND